MSWVRTATPIDLALCYSLVLLKHLKSPRIHPPLPLSPQEEGMLFPACQSPHDLHLPCYQFPQKPDGRGIGQCGEPRPTQPQAARAQCPLWGCPCWPLHLCLWTPNSKAITNTKAAGFRQNNISASLPGACPGCCVAGGWRGREQILLPLTAPRCLTAAYCRLQDISIHNAKCPPQER